MPAETRSFENEIHNSKGMSLEQYYLNVPVNINDNSEINKMKVQEQSQIYFNVPPAKQTALERQINAEFD